MPCLPSAPVSPTEDAYLCRCCGYSECSLLHHLGRFVDWLRDRDNTDRCPRCTGEMRLHVQYRSPSQSGWPPSVFSSMFY